MNAVQRAQRRHDLLLAADVLRRQVDASLTTLAPAADRALHWVAIGQQLRRRTAGTRRLAALLAAAGTAIGGTGIGWVALRHWRWLSSLWIGWQMWRQWRR